MITLDNLQKYLDDYLFFDKTLNLSQIDQYMGNGLIVKGKEEITKIGFGVSASLALFEKAKELDCDVVIVHHAFNLPAYNRYDQIFQNRIGYLLKNEISLFGYHFLLDAHPEVGNNAEILRILGAKPVKPYSFHDQPWGWVGEMEQEEELEKLINKLKPYLSQRAVIYQEGNRNIRKIVAISGKGAPFASAMQDLIDEKIDLYITGEVHEWNRELFREAKINFLAGGHYHTEVFGMKALMEKVKKEFPQVSTSFLELPNEV